MLTFNPYQAQAGQELDTLVHLLVMKQASVPGHGPAYSSEMTAAKKVLTRLKAAYHTSIISGRTSLAERAWFARIKTHGKHGTEVLAETLPLAICRLALLQVADVEAGNGI